MRGDPERSGERDALGPAELQHHLLEEILPLWCEHGVDRVRGGFHPKLTLDLKPGPDTYKRLVSTTRQIYAFSHAALLGAPAWALETAAHGLEFLRDKFWDTRNEGWFLTTTLDGEPLDRRKDSYAHAFVLFALAYYYRASEDSEALRVAEHTLELLEAHLLDREHGGFLEATNESWEPLAQPRRQNPHMHLLEAFLALRQATGESRYLEHAQALAQLFRSRFLDPERGCLGEYFEADWAVAPGDVGQLLEPGHHFEWVWLLHQYASITGDESTRAEAEQLFVFAERHGVDAEHGGVFDAIDRGGRVRRDTKRLWPQTELIKALVARYEASGDAAILEPLQGALRHVFRHYVDPRHRGWRDHLTREGELHVDLMPATSVYHITLALSEVMRVLGKDS